MLYLQFSVRFIIIIRMPPFLRNYSLCQNAVSLAMVGLGAL